MPVKQLTKKLRYLALVLLSILASCAIYSLFGLTQPMEAWMCNPNGYAIRIIDDSVTSEVRSVEAVNDPYFKSFVTSLTKYISSRFPNAGSCTENSDKGAMSSLTFVRLPLVTSGNNPLAAPPKLSPSFPGITCGLDSPWVKLAIRNSDKRVVQGVFIWNERQFLGDQALLANPNLSLNSPLVPLSSRLFQKYANDYADSEILRSPSGDSPQLPISKRIPADVLWLFRHSSKTTFLPFTSVALSAMRKTTEQGVTGYTNLAKTLVDQCSSLIKTEIRYENILDLKKYSPLTNIELTNFN